MNIDPKALGAHMAGVVKSYCGPLFDSVTSRIDALQKSLEELPIPENGKDGKDGEPGSNGADGLPGADGANGQDGKDGESGVDGRDGRDGIDGRDALDIDVIQGINEEKSYPRGTMAAHDGSLWMARKNTDGMEGWHCIVAGMGEPRIDYDGERSFTITIPYGGAEITRKAILPVVLDAGFYQEGKTYQPGDGVTFGGSYWIAKADTGTKPGTGNDDWRLAVKKGRDSKGGA